MGLFVTPELVRTMALHTIPSLPRTTSCTTPFLRFNRFESLWICTLSPSLIELVVTPPCRIEHAFTPPPKWRQVACPFSRSPFSSHLRISSLSLLFVSHLSALLEHSFSATTICTNAFFSTLFSRNLPIFLLASLSHKLVWCFSPHFRHLDFD